MLTRRKQRQPFSYVLFIAAAAAVTVGLLQAAVYALFCLPVGQGWLALVALWLVWKGWAHLLCKCDELF